MKTSTYSPTYPTPNNETQPTMRPGRDENLRGNRRLQHTGAVTSAKGTRGGTKGCLEFQNTYFLLHHLTSKYSKIIVDMSKKIDYH